MLYNPEWKSPTTTPADLWSLPRFIAWLETRDPAEEYNYISHESCLIAQYLTACGLSDVLVYPYSYKCNGAKGESDIPLVITDIANEPYHQTFGEALARARAALDSQKG